ncbi:ABC-type transport system involved in resistance to organic solvents, periplasmic component [Aequorivita sublithincola DSM 14238]|uniref:ABC-type transport system involved in resistance to organic solvents, periplasmic component n=1 Tax=Aequorivita sublithincola (strain DSM 14238 / LMG 21431 / ACAM 643 / 9-3) TaxID=746697 RepID=I3YYY0_AEQSU|nr:MlaD family protein [Aequorivita sublithincola]AFL82198.1 ABC-type transport system involved in resistance to organic solvents, periplasmic component [Aequorivita sublithincola DSM 14238]
MRLSREVKTGILAIGAILLLIFGYSFLKGTNLLDKNREFFVKYDNVEGLAQAAPVTINGLTVGKVQNISFANSKGGLVVKFTVEKDFDFSKNSIVRIYSSGLLGGKNLGIFPEYDANNIAKSGDTLRGDVEDGMLTAVSKALGPLEKKVNNTLATVDTLLLNVNAIVDEKTRKNLKEAIENLNNTLNSFSGVSENLNYILSNNTGKLDNTFSNLDKTANNLSKLTDSLAQLETGKLVTDLQSVVDKMDKIVSGVDNGDGSIGKLLKDDKLYENLEGASRQLEQLLQDVKLNPKRYVHISVFGKKNKDYETPDNPEE